MQKSYKISYKVLRSIFFTAIIVVAALYVLLYVGLSLPWVQRSLLNVATNELSKFLDSKVEVDRVDFSPFNEAKLHDVRVYDQTGRICLFADEIGAGIDLWTLITRRKIIITYAELVGLDGRIYQQQEGAPLNIDFIIKAFAPKDKNKPPTKFDLMLHNVVIRKSRLSFDRLWMGRGEKDRFDLNHIKLYDLRADIALPTLKNDDFVIDCRRLAMREISGLDLESIKFLCHLTSRSISIKSLQIKFPGTTLSPSDITLNFEDLKHIQDALSTGSHTLSLVDNPVTPSDFKAFYPPLGQLNEQYELSLDLSGNIKRLDLDKLKITSASKDFTLLSKAYLGNLTETGGLRVEDATIDLGIQSRLWPAIKDIAGESVKNPAFDYLQRLGDLKVSVNGGFDGRDMAFAGDGRISTSSGDINFEAKGSYRSKLLKLIGSTEISEFKVGEVLNKEELGIASLTANCDIELVGKDLTGEASADITTVGYNGRQFNDITVNATKTGDDFELQLTSADTEAHLDLEAAGRLDGPEKRLVMAMNIDNLDLDAVVPNSKNLGKIYANIEGNVSGSTIDNLSGIVSLHNARWQRDGKNLDLDNLKVVAQNRGDGDRFVHLDSDWMRFDIRGHYTYSDMARQVQDMIADALPALIRRGPKPENDVNVDFSARMTGLNPVTDFFNLPVALGSDLTVKGDISSVKGEANCIIDAPYIVQNRKKLIKNTGVTIHLGKESESILRAETTMPVKNWEATLNLGLTAYNDDLGLKLGWDVDNEKEIYGEMSINSRLTVNPMSKIPDLNVNILPSEFSISGAGWNIDRASVVYADNKVDIKDLKIWHDGQFVSISGGASSSEDDELLIRLNDIDLDYIFNTLNINYVTFGGHATGEVVGRSLLSKSPEARTRTFEVRDFSYNGALLGDAKIRSHWDNERQKVAIFADVREGDERRALVDGGIWVTRDSLSFDMEANKINASMLQPFMAAFSSDIEGRASGKLKLYGSFKDVDLVGRAFADTIRMKIDYTNVYYAGSDSVIMDKGHVRIPNFKLYDKNGNTAILSGDLRHSYFHNPEFEFRLNDAQNLLCYDVNGSMNPVWYGTIYGNGSAVLRGRPGLVDMVVDMTTAPNSTFTFVLSDTQEAADYKFLTFSDKRKERREAEMREKSGLDSIPDMTSLTAERPTVFRMQIRGTVTESALLTLVMDPIAGDKITAHGDGSLQIGYDTESDEMTMYGKYSLVSGNYNFSLQDLILRDFTIQRGSTISFNGDPMQANLDISATYRVNTNLSDLDKSFSLDRELNRTNVPVDAVLNVRGDMQNPNISFDIALPTLTEDMVRKVKSVISTDDMMNRQIIYLLALNRFYTPEYMGQTGNGGELASVASSTISSQLSNIMGQLTDKFTLAPSFRSDKGDFSDMEVDVALSSRLLNNRLLINGNFGYRDRSTSSTTFVGDFDIEYLLSKSGNLRLKAYNHFNDQNYYLQSSLTTQGIGVVYRRDFDNPFTFLHRKKRKIAPAPSDSIPAVAIENDVVEKTDSVRK